MVLHVAASIGDRLSTVPPLRNRRGMSRWWRGWWRLKAVSDEVWCRGVARHLWSRLLKLQAVQSRQGRSNDNSRGKTIRT